MENSQGQNPKNLQKGQITAKFLAKFLKDFKITEVPDTLVPLDAEAFEEIMESMLLRGPIDVDYLSKLGVEDPDELLERILEDMEELVNDRNIRLENRNVIAVSGNALAILLNNWILKYPLNEFLQPLLEAEVEKHIYAYRLYCEWVSDSRNHGLPFDPKNKFAIPQWKLNEEGYRIEYVGRSLDVLVLESLICDIDPEFEARLAALNPKMMLRQLTPAQLILLLKKLLHHNIAAIRDEDFYKSELLSPLIACAQPCLTQEHFDALNSFLDYGYQNGFLYLDKIVDNSTLHENGRMYLIDYGISEVFDKGKPTFSLEKYGEMREELIAQQITPFLQNGTVLKTLY
ncbi:MAG: hypothetical protein HQM14_10140 [SAR324 cluster bacterium]|nr:hypothetical protein [SAR324 cluster bacterium]